VDGNILGWNKNTSSKITLILEIFECKIKQHFLFLSVKQQIGINGYVIKGNIC